VKKIEKEEKEHKSKASAVWKEKEIRVGEGRKNQHTKKRCTNHTKTFKVGERNGYKRKRVDEGKGALSAERGEFREEEELRSNEARGGK